MIQWIRRSFIAGFFVTVPLVISVAAIVWIFRLIDGWVGPFYARWLRHELPGLGILTTAALVLLVGAFATNVIGKRLLQRAESYLLRVPVFRTIYSPVKQLVVAFSPDNDAIQRVVLVEEPTRGFVLAFSRRSSPSIAGRGPNRWWRYVRRTISISATSSCVLATRRRFRHHGRAGHSRFSDRWHGTVEPRSRAPRRRPRRPFPV
jgi:hypothetical protein